jgi:NADH-quinone oxidoreductase subunit N
VWGLIGLTGAVVSSVLLWNRSAVGFGVIVADNFGLFVTVTLAVVGALTLLFSAPIVERDGLPAGEYYALVLFAIVGMMMMATARDLLVIFVALEVLSLAVYVLTSIRRDNANSTGSRVQVLPARRLSRARSSSTASRSPTA